MAALPTNALFAVGVGAFEFDEFIKFIFELFILLAFVILEGILLLLLLLLLDCCAWNSFCELREGDLSILTALLLFIINTCCGVADVLGFMGTAAVGVLTFENACWSMIEFLASIACGDRLPVLLLLLLLFDSNGEAIVMAGDWLLFVVPPGNCWLLFSLNESVSNGCE